MRALLFLVIIGLLAAIIVSLVRRGRRSRDEQEYDEPRVPPGSKPAAPAALPPPVRPASSVAADAAKSGGDEVAPQSAAPLTIDQVLHKLNELAFGRELGAARAGDIDIVTAATQAMTTAATEPRYAPRRPMLLPQLLRAAGDQDTSRRELSTLISKDPSLVGSLLKLANSQFYRVNAQPVESVDRAVAVIGTEGIRSLIAAAVVQPVFRVSGGDFPHFPEVVWEHTFLSANAAETYAAVIVNSDPFAAQLLALVNGLGAIVVFKVMMDQYGSKQLRQPDAATIVSMLEAHTASVARSIAASWDLSARILTALEEQIPGAEARHALEQPSPLGRALRFGNFIGALAVLNAKGIVSDEVAKATLLANHASGAHFERIWERLTGKKAAVPPRHQPSPTLPQ